MYSLSKIKSNYISFNTYLLIETICLYVFYQKIVFGKLVKKILSVVIILLVLFWINGFIKAGQNEFLYYSVTFENIFILVFAIYYYYEQVIILNKSYIYTKIRFWIVTAFFVNAAGTFFLLLYIPSLNNEDQQRYYLLNYLFVIIRTVLLSIAMFGKSEDLIKKGVNQFKSRVDK